MMKRPSLKYAVLLLTLLLTMLAGCHGKKSLEPFSVPETFDENTQYTISFWAKNDTNKTQTAIYNKAISDFEKLYPNIDVNLKLYTNYNTIYNDVITNIATNTTPNVCITYPDHIATYLSGKNIVVPLDELMDNSDYGLSGSKVKFDAPKKSEIKEKFLKEGIISDSTYALPFMRSTEALYINKDYVEKLGYEIPEVVTWDFVFDVSEKAMELSDDGSFKVNGQNVLIPFIYKSTDNMMIQMLKQKNAGYSDDDGNILIFNDTTRDIIKTVAEHGKSRAFSTFKISSYPANFLNAGQCIFAIDSTAGSTWMGTDAPLSDISQDKIVKFTTEVRPVPQYDVNNIEMISQGPSICLFNKANSGEVMASWLFMQYLLTNDVQVAYAKTEGYIPVTNKATDSPEYNDYLNNEGADKEHYDVKIKASKLMLENVDKTFVTPVFNGSASLRDAAGQLIENTVKSVRRKENVDDAYIEKLFSDVSSLYRLDSSMKSESGEKAELGPLPAEAKTLIAVLFIVWFLIGAYYVRTYIKQKN